MKFSKDLTQSTNMNSPITQNTIDLFVADGKANLIINTKISSNQVDPNFTLFWRSKKAEDETQTELKEGIIIFEDIRNFQSIYKQYGK